MTAKKTTTAKKEEPKKVDVSELGIREHRLVSVQPVEVEERGGTKIVEIRQTVIKKNLPQPLLELHEAKKLGRQKWHPFRNMKDIFTTVVDGRRFLVEKHVYDELDKD